MYYLIDMCYVCLKNKKPMFHLTDVDDNNITYFTKMISVMPVLNENKINHSKYICEECTHVLEIVYNFFNKCIRNAVTFESYFTLLGSSNTVRGELKVVLNDIRYNVAKDSCRNSQDNQISNDTEFVDVTKDYKRNKDVGIYERELLNSEETNFDNFIKLESTLEHIKYEEKSNQTEKIIDQFTKIVNKDNGHHQQEEHKEDEELVDTIKHEVLDVLEYEPASYLEYLYRKEDVAETAPIYLTTEKRINTCNTVKEIAEAQNGLYRYTPYSNFSDLNTSTEAKLFKCNKKFDPFSYIQEHMLLHSDKNFQDCNMCMRKFLESTAHMCTHTVDNASNCEVCRKTFGMTDQRSQQMQHQTGVKSYECKICNKTFSASWNLIRHVRGHTGEKNYECDRCFKRFTHRHNVIRHLRIHTGEKPYECKICKKTFKRNDEVTRHMKTHSDKNVFRSWK